MLAPHQKAIIVALRSEGTLKLFLLGLVTLGIYMAHYVQRQSLILNEFLEEEQKISTNFTWAFLGLSYFSVLMIIPYIMVEAGHPMELFSDVLDLAWGIMMVVWAFMARSRMNLLLGAEKGSAEWFNAFWTFFFCALYFNIKINKLSDEPV